MPSSHDRAVSISHGHWAGPSVSVLFVFTSVLFAFALAFVGGLRGFRAPLWIECDVIPIQAVFALVCATRTQIIG